MNPGAPLAARELGRTSYSYNENAIKSFTFIEVFIAIQRLHEHYIVLLLSFNLRSSFFRPLSTYSYIDC